RGRLLAWLAGRAGGGRASTWRGFLLASAGRRGAAINRGLLVAGLLLAFGVNLGLFAATYDQQARVDAQLTLGADVVATAPPGAIRRHALEQRVALLSGVAGTTALDRSYAYVGPDLQDIFGIDARTLTRGTSLRDSYFLGGSAAQILARLRSTPDGADRQLDHDRRSRWNQPNRGDLRARARGRRDGALRRGRARRAAAGVRHHGRARRGLARDRGLPLDGNCARPRCRTRAGGAPRLAARGDARRNAAARVRSAARPPRRTLVLPRRPRRSRRCRRSDRSVGCGCRDQAHAAGGNTA